MMCGMWIFLHLDSHNYALLLICDIMDLLFLLSGFIRYTIILVLCECNEVVIFTLALVNVMPGFMKHIQSGCITFL